MWWKNSVVYQIYPRSFKDSNNDGVGDIKGIISKLDYLAYLGVDVLWLCPVYPTPNKDNGYDISDYYGINPEFGTMEDMKELIQEAKDRGISIMMDIVANHTSSAHRWFVEAVKSKDNAYHDYYVFREGQDGPPSDLQSIFLQSAWEKNEQTDEYYLHMFAVDQPDLNWHNEEVRKEIYDILQYWIDLGVKGFRFDVIDLIAKDLENGIVGDGPKLHDYIREMSDKVLRKADLITVGETWGATVEKAKMYSNLDQSEFSMIFNFEHSLLDQEQGKEKWDLKPLDLRDLKRVFNAQQVGLHNAGWNSLFWNNHDLPRVVSRWGNDKEYRVESAKMLATLLHLMQGTPYIYQGEELGMTNNDFAKFEHLRDIESLRMIDDRINRGFTIESIRKSIAVKGRDNARTPMQWSSELYAGFSEKNPWIEVNSNYVDINVAKQLGDKDSVLEYYRSLITLRRNSAYRDLIEKGTFEMIEVDHQQVFAYKRTYGNRQLLIICNFYGETVALSKEYHFAKMVLSNKGKPKTNIVNILRPYEAMVVESTIDS